MRTYTDVEKEEVGEGLGEGGYTGCVWRSQRMRESAGGDGSKGG